MLPKPFRWLFTIKIHLIIFWMISFCGVIFNTQDPSKYDRACSFLTTGALHRAIAHCSCCCHALSSCWCERNRWCHCRDLKKNTAEIKKLQTLFELTKLLLLVPQLNVISRPCVGWSNRPTYRLNCLLHFYMAIRPLWPQSWLLNLSWEWEQ